MENDGLITNTGAQISSFCLKTRPTQDKISHKTDPISYIQIIAWQPNIPQADPVLSFETGQAQYSDPHRKIKMQTFSPESDGR